MLVTLQSKIRGDHRGKEHSNHDKWRSYRYSEDPEIPIDLVDDYHYHRDTIGQDMI
jgi:nitrogen regulatory protein PII-like uncharacterized protein